MSKKSNRSSAVRKIDPVTDQVIVTEAVIGQIPDMEVLPVSGMPVATAVGAMKGVNPIVSAGHDLDVLRKLYTTKSGVIRFLASKGFETKHIATFCGIRYQHVRNVLTTQLKKPVSLASPSVVVGAGATEQAAQAKPETE